MKAKQVNRIMKTRFNFLLVSLVLLVVGGFWFAYYRSNIADMKIKNRILSDAVELAHSLNLQLVKNLTFTAKDKDSPAYQRISEQMRAYGKLIYQQGIYSMKLIDGKIYFGPESYPETDPDASPPGTLYEEPSESDFEVLRTGNPAVFGPITDEYGSFISALAPVIDPLTGETLMVVGIDIPAEIHQKTIRASRYLPITLTGILFFLVLTGFFMINKRLHFSPEKKSKYRYLEAMLVFIAGVIITTSLTILTNEAERNEKEQIFNSKSYAYTDILRNALQSIQQDIQNIDMFQSHSSYMSAREFKGFVQPMVNTSTGEAYLWAPVNKTVPEMENHPSDIAFDPEYSIPQGVNNKFLNKNLFCDSIVWQAILRSIFTNLVTASDSFLTLNPENPKCYLLVTKSVFKPEYYSEMVSGDTIIGVVGIIINLQKTLENSLKGSGQHKEYFESGIYDLTSDKPHLIASLPLNPEKNKHLSLQQSKNDSRYFSRLIPLFAFGKTFALVAKPTPAFHRAYPIINSTFSLTTGLLITIILSLFVSFQRNRQYFLEQSVSQRTSELNQRVKELTCLNRINDELRTVQNPDILYRKIIGHLQNGMEHPELVFPEIEIDNIKYFNEGSSAERNVGKMVEEINLFGQPKGKITMYLKRDASFLAEEQNMIKNAAQLLSRWLERTVAENTSRQRESEIKAFMDASTESILLIDTDGRIITANSEFSRLFNTPVNKLTDANIFDILPERNSKYSKTKVAEMLLTNLPVRYELEQSGRIFYISLSPVRNQEDKIINIAVFGIDITERKNIETELKKAIEKVEASDQLKTAFLNNISHEVRTPLNGILGFADIISQPGITQSEIEQCLDILHTSSKRLVDTINDYMDMSLIVSGNLHIIPQPFFLKKTLMDVYDNFEPFSVAKNLNLQLEITDKDANFLFNQDEELVKKVISQLVDNAIKFSLKGTITFGFNIKDNLVHFHVTDEGIGISAEALNRIFENFVQEDISRTRQHEGSGLGLSIAKGLVNLLKGTIRVVSVKGVGSSFYFTLPVDAGQKEIFEDVPGLEAGEMKDHPVILIVEDDESSYLYLESVFRKRNINLLRAKNGIQAVELCKNQPEIKLILMDLKMPLLDGFEATRQIKSFRPDIPVIAITAFALSGDERKALDAGCDDYLTKPLKSDALMKKLEKYGIVVIK